MKLWGLLIGAAAIVACGSADDSDDLFGQKVCVPGATAECACPGGAKGAQACRDDGSGYAACQCGGVAGSGGSAGVAGAGQSGSGGAAGSGGSGTGGAGGSCTPRSMCPAPEPDGGAPLCGQLDDYCGGKLSCGCEYGECAASCSCWHNRDYDQPCGHAGYPALAVQCTPGKRPTGRTCNLLGASPVVVPPPGTFCCQ